MGSTSTGGQPGAPSPGMSRMCRRTAVAFWVVASLLAALVGTIVVLAVTRRPETRRT